MAPNNQAQMLMLLNQVTNLENQLRGSNMAQNQPMGMAQNQSMGMAQNQPMGMFQNQGLVQNQGMGMTQNQGMGTNSSNLLTMLSQLKGLQTSMPNMKKNTKGGQGKGRQARVNPSLNLGSNLATLLASVTGGSEVERGRCVWVTGIPEAYRNADKLLNIFGNFGNVQKIVFSEKKPDGALIEMDDVRSAVKAKMNMQNQKIDGSEIKVGFTKIDTAKMKKEDTKSKDVRQAKENWRYSKDGKFRKICMSRLRNLSNNIVVSNVPEGKIDQLKKYIIESGYTVKSVEGSKRPDAEDKPSTGYTMAIIELPSIEEAIGAVANLHNTWPKKFGTMKKDLKGNDRGLVFSLAGIKKEKIDKA